MTAARKHETPAPAGTPGNMQDVADLQQMLAQSQAELRAEKDRRRDAEAAEARLRIEVTLLKGGLADLQDEARDAEDRAQDAEDQLRRAQEKLGDIPIDLSDLVLARELLFKGDHRGGRDQLERVLDRLNPCWRTSGCNVGELDFE
jgi:chromosome segregation ATPase